MLKRAYKFECRCVACLSPEKYKMDPKLDIKDLGILIIENTMVLVGNDFDEAFKKFERFCRYVQKNYARNYPSQELSILQNTFLRILTVFLMNEMY